MRSLLNYQPLSIKDSSARPERDEKVPNLTKHQNMQTTSTPKTGGGPDLNEESSIFFPKGYPSIQLKTLYDDNARSMFLNKNMLLFVTAGTMTIRYGKIEYAVNKNQIVFLKKDILIEYKADAESETYEKIEFITFSVSYELIKEFAKLAEICVISREHHSSITVDTIDVQLQNYIDFIRSYFTGSKQVEANLVKIKLLELLFYLSKTNGRILEQLLDLRDHFRSNITTTVEENLMNSLSLHQLAVLTGRSLSSFRRDFLAIYNVPPSQWIRHKRLEKAQELLLNTTMSVTDICYTTGFENIAHFSRLFKSRFRYSPSEFRSNLLVA